MEQIPVVPVLEIGKEYDITHSRKGSFHFKISNVRGEWATGVITDGQAKAYMDYNVGRIGDTITIRITQIVRCTEIK